MANKRIVNVCTYCQCVMDADGNAFVRIELSRVSPAHVVSHGCCNSCLQKERADLAALKLEKAGV